VINEEYISQFIDAVKDWAESANKVSNRGKKSYFSEYQKLTSEHEKEVSYHAKFGVFPEDIINKAAPNETKEEFDYRKENYKQVTKPAWDKAMSFVYRIWNKQNYSIKLNEDYKEYFTSDYPVYDNFINFFRDVVTKKKVSDPNCIAAVKPYMIPTKEVEQDGELVTIYDQSEMVDPVLCLYPASSVFVFKEDELVIVLRDEKTDVLYGGKTVKDGMWFEIYDRTGIYWLKQFGKKVDYQFEFELYYEHDYDGLPCWRLGGIPTYDESEYYYHSYFSGALPNLDQAVFISSTLFSAIVKHGFPTRWYYEDSCGDCSGTGWVTEYDGSEHGTKARCAACHGSGNRMTFSWGKDYKVQLPENTADASRLDVGSLPTPPFGMVSPDTSVLEFLDTKTKDLINEAFQNLNIDIGNKPNGQTATESKIDREEAFSFLLQYAYELFDLLEKSMRAIIWMRWMDAEPELMVVAPNEFTIRSSEALTEEFSRGVEAQLPEPYLNKLLTETVQQRFNDKSQERLVEVVSKVDSLLTKTDVQIVTLKNVGAIQQWQIVLHANIFRYIGEIMTENEDFLEGDIYKDILPVLKARAEQDVVVTSENPLSGLIN